MSELILYYVSKNINFYKFCRISLWFKIWLNDFDIFCLKSVKKQEKIAFFSVFWSVLGEWNHKIQPFFLKISKINNKLANQYKKLWIRGFLARNFNFFLKVMFVEISLFFIQYVHSKKYKVFTTPCRFKTTLWKSLIF